MKIGFFSQFFACKNIMQSNWDYFIIDKKANRKKRFLFILIYRRIWTTLFFHVTIVSMRSTEKGQNMFFLSVSFAFHIADRYYACIRVYTIQWLKILPFFALPVNMLIKTMMLALQSFFLSLRQRIFYFIDNELIE